MNTETIEQIKEDKISKMTENSKRRISKDERVKLRLTLRKTELTHISEKFKADKTEVGKYVFNRIKNLLE